MDFDYSIEKARLGDKFLESEYGQTIYGEVITEPITSKDGYISFDAKMSDGRVVTYGGPLNSSTYWPKIVKVVDVAASKADRK